MVFETATRNPALVPRLNDIVLINQAMAVLVDFEALIVILELLVWILALVIYQAMAVLVHFDAL
jgi:hypothetical protein